MSISEEGGLSQDKNALQDDFPYKIELHVHLDGAVRPQTVLDLSREQGVDLPIKSDADIKELMCVTEPGDFAYFLGRFDAIVPRLAGNLDAIRRVTSEFCEDCARQNIKYCEVRYNPHFFSSVVQNDYIVDKHCKLTPRDVVIEVNNTLKKKSKELGITVYSILCCVISEPGWSEDIVNLCKEFRNDGVVAIDIAAGEKSLQQDPGVGLHLKAFQEAERCGIHRTAHAGEVGPAEVVREMVDVYRAERIGHGYHTLDDQILYAEMLEKNIHMECCPVSSYCTGAVNVDLNKHPIKRFFDDGANVSLNTDDPSIFDCSMLDNYVLVKKMGVTDKQIITSIFNAARSCFASDEEKARLLSELKDVYGDKYSSANK